MLLSVRNLQLTAGRDSSGARRSGTLVTSSFPLSSARSHLRCTRRSDWRRVKPRRCFCDRKGGGAKQQQVIRSHPFGPALQFSEISPSCAPPDPSKGPFWPPKGIQEGTADRRSENLTLWERGALAGSRVQEARKWWTEPEAALCLKHVAVDGPLENDTSPCTNNTCTLKLRNAQWKN